MMPAHWGILNWLILRADMSQKFFKGALFCDNVCRSSLALRHVNTSNRTQAQRGRSHWLHDRGDANLIHRNG